MQTVPPRQPAFRSRLAGNKDLVILGCLIGVALTVSLLVGLRWLQAEIVDRRTQPAAVTYDDGRVHHVGLIRRHNLLGGLPYRLVAGSDPGLGYGHVVEISATAETLRISAAEWTPAGLRVRFTGGHEVFVPARKFTHGR